MLAVHFGAGNIGRGFIGKLLSESGYETCFIDVNDQVVQLLNERKEYKVVIADETKEEVTVQNVFAKNSIAQREEVIEIIAKADLVTTAVGPNILPLIAPLISEGVKKRFNQSTTPLNIIACENMIGGSAFLKEKVFENLSHEEVKEFQTRLGFPNSAVDRIVPNQTNEDPLMVMVEPFFEWVVDETEVVGSRPDVSGITYVKDLKPYIERKLFTVNTGHAACAYLGYLYGFETIDQAMKDERIQAIVQNTVKETGRLLTTKYDLDEAEHEKYREKIIQRFLNPALKDEVTRVGRSPIRKLGAKDRLTNPATQYLELVGEVPSYLAKSIASALHFNYAEDAEAQTIQQAIEEKGLVEAIVEFTGLSQESPLTKEIMNQYEELEKVGGYRLLFLFG